VAAFCATCGVASSPKSETEGDGSIHFSMT
jgi:hypothetical protein